MEHPTKHPSLRQHCTRLPSPHPSHRPVPDRWSPTTTPGPPTTFRRTRPRQQLHPALLEPTARSDRRPRPKTRHPLMPPLRSDARGIRDRRSQTSPTPPNQTYTDGSRSENRGWQRRHELQLSTLNTNRLTHLSADRRLATSRSGWPGTGLTLRTWTLLPERNAFICIVTGPFPHLRTKRKPQVPRTCGVAWRHPISGFPPRGFPARCVPDRARVCTRPKETGSPTGPVLWPLAL